MLTNPRDWRICTKRGTLTDAEFAAGDKRRAVTALTQARPRYCLRLDASVNAAEPVTPASDETGSSRATGYEVGGRVVL